MGCWVSTYVGFPASFKSDQESAVVSDAFRKIATAHGIKIAFSGVASHNSMGQIEGAHAPLRRVFRMFHKEHPSLSDNLKLRLSVKALNDTAGPEGLVPSLLVFGVIPSLGNTEANLVDQERRFRAMHLAPAEAAKITAEERIRIALRSNVPPSAKYDLQSGQSVMAYSEKKREWISDLKVVKALGKHVWVNTGKRIYMLNKSHVVPKPADDDRSAVTTLL